MWFLDRFLSHVTLLDVRHPDIRVRLEASFGEDGDLWLIGQDLGPRVEELTGEDEYEYFLTVRAEHLPAVATALACKRAYLLAALRDAYAARRFVGTADLKAFLAERGVPCETHVC